MPYYSSPARLFCSFFLYSFATVPLLVPTPAYPTFVVIVVIFSLSNARIWPLSLFGVSVPRLNTHIYLHWVTTQSNVCLLFSSSFYSVCEYTGLRSVSPRYPSVRLHFCYVYNILYWIETETERLIFMPVLFFHSLSRSLCSFVLLLVSAAIALISSDCGNVYSHCIRILAPRHNRTLSQWQFHSVLCVLWWFVFFYILLLCVVFHSFRISLITHLTLLRFAEFSSISMRRRRWVYSIYPLCTYIMSLFCTMYFVQSPCVVVLILPSLSVCLSLAPTLTLSLGCLLLLLLLLYHPCLFCIFRIEFICFNSSSHHFNYYSRANGTACKIHSKCNAFFGEFYVIRIKNLYECYFGSCVKSAPTIIGQVERSPLLALCTLDRTTDQATKQRVDGETASERESKRAREQGSERPDEIKCNDTHTHK